MKPNQYDPHVIQPKPIVQSVNKALGKLTYIPKTATSCFLAMCCMGIHPSASAINSSDLNGDNGFNVEKINIDDRLHLREKSVSDVNGDGIADVLIDNSKFFRKENAKTHIVFGAAGNTIPAAVKPEDLDGSNGFTIDAQFKGTVDINGDGITDIIATDFSSVLPQNMIILGQDVSTNGNFPANLSSSDLNGKNGFQIVDAVNDGDLFIASQGDLSGDGIDDIVISENHSLTSSYYTIRYKTSLYFVFGRENQEFPDNLSLSQLDGKDGFRIDDAFMGYSDDITSSSSFLDSDNRIDFNGDGINELMYIDDEYFGGSYFYSTHELNLADITVLESNGEFPAVVDGLPEIPTFSTSVTNGDGSSPGRNGNIGDINDDGVDDIAQVSSYDPNYYTSSNRAVITFGEQINSVSLSGIKQLILTKESTAGSTETNDLLITALGDINGDGVDDVHLMTVNNYSNDAKDSFILFGRNTSDDGEFPEHITQDFFNGSNGFVLRGNTGASSLTRREYLQPTGDFNDDGINDLVYLINVYNNSTQDFEMTAHIIYGQSEPFPEIVLVSTSSDSNEVVAEKVFSSTTFGDTSTVADVNNDGADDLIIDSDLISVIYGVPEPSYSPRLVCPGDVDNNGVEDLAVLSINQAENSVHVVVKDLQGQLISSVEFDGNFNPSALKLIDDINNNLSAELVVIDINTAKAEIRDALTGDLLNTITFHPRGDSVDIEPLADQNGNNAMELASLNGIGKVKVKDALNSQTISMLNFQNGNFIAEDIEILNTLPPQTAVLSENKDQLKIDKVAINDMSTGRTLKNLWFGRQWDVLQLELLADLNGNGSPEAAVLRQQKDKVNVLIRDTKTGSLINSQGHSPQYRPLVMDTSEDINNNASEEIVLLSQKIEGGQIAATVKDSSTNETINRQFFNKNLQALDMAVCDDMNGNNKPEIVVLGAAQKNGELRLVVRDISTGELIGRVEF